MVTKKNILITAGSTWVAIDKVRVISNIASGQTGFILAEKFKKLGAKVTLLLGPGSFCKKIAGIKVIRFKYFTELEKLLAEQLKTKKYSVVIHAAAVADYKPKRVIGSKVSSKLKNWKINFVPTKKIIATFKNYKNKLFTVGFKFEPTAGDGKLIKDAKLLLKKEGLNLVVANSNRNSAYRSFILSNTDKCGPFLNKVKMAERLSKLIAGII